MPTKTKAKTRKKPLNRVAKMWIRALRSGKIKQAHSQLGTEDGKRCCLGVLCDLAVKEKVIKSYALRDILLPYEVMYWAGLNFTDARFNGTSATDSPNLWKHNDGYYQIDPATGKKYTKKSFKKIADIIESQPEGMFK